MHVVYSQHPFHEGTSIFLAGPTPRARNPVPSWRPEAISILERLGFEGSVMVPEDADGEWRMSYLDQVEWEMEGLTRADVIVFWVPRDLDTMPGFTTNVEFGRWVTSGKIVLGHPEGAPKTSYLDWLLMHEQGEKAHLSLEETLQAAIDRIVGR